MVDDSSKFNRNRQAGQPSLNRGASPSKGPDHRERAIPSPRYESVEMTPTPIVLGAPSETLRHGVGGQRNDKTPEASEDLPETLELPVVKRAPTGTTSLPKESIETISYHPPRKPPNSVVPPPPSATISVAPEYDPRAPTKPRVRRISSHPPALLLFGFDRMLIWGMLLGGLFVAVVFILVHRLAPGVSRDANRNEVRPRDPKNESAPQIAMPAKESQAPSPSKAATSEIPLAATAVNSLADPSAREPSARPAKTRLPRKPRESKAPTEQKEPPWIE